MSPKNTQDIAIKSKEHLINLRAVFQKNPELIDEFVRALRFNCPIKYNKDCECCNYAIQNNPEDEFYECRLFCEAGLQKLDGLMDLVRKDLLPAQEQILEVCVTVSIGKDVGKDGLPFVDDWIIRGRTPEELVKSVLDTIACDLIEHETLVANDYANSLASSTVFLIKAGDA